jgi:protein MAK16
VLASASSCPGAVVVLNVAVMQNDDVIWSLIGNKRFCRYKVKTRRQQENFCLNEYNVTGMCSRQSCPLANSRYATIREAADGRLYLFIKTIERAHMPRKLWQKIRLSGSYTKALSQIDEHLAMWPKFLVHRAKQRLTKLTQYLLRKQRLESVEKTQLLPVKKKVERRERKQEQRALDAAKLSLTIENELLARLKQGKYGEIFNFAQKEFEHVMEQEAEPLELERDLDRSYFEPLYESSDEEAVFGAGDDSDVPGTYTNAAPPDGEEASWSDGSAMDDVPSDSADEDWSPAPDLEDLPHPADRNASTFYFDEASDSTEADERLPTRPKPVQRARVAQEASRRRKTKASSSRHRKQFETEFEFERELEPL